MKSILLASTALVAFAGAAAAGGHTGVSFGGEATLGYNDVAEGGFYWSSAVSVTMAAELDNGLTASAEFGVDITDGNLGQSLESADYVLSLTSDMSGLYFGDTDQAAGVNFSAGSALDGAPETDFDEDGTGDAVLRGEYSTGDYAVAVSYGVMAGGDMGEMQLSASASLGAATVSLAYQDGDADGLDGDGEAEYIVGEAMALGVAASFGGADVNFGYLSTDADTSIGFGVSYPIDPVTVSAYFTSNDVADDAWGIGVSYAADPVTLGFTYESDDSWEVTAGYASGAVSIDAAFDSDDDFSVEGSYDAGNGLTVYAGMINAGDDLYLGGAYDLGGGASLLVSYAEDDDNGEEDEIGAQEYMRGTTIEMSFSF